MFQLQEHGTGLQLGFNGRPCNKLPRRLPLGGQPHTHLLLNFCPDGHGLKTVKS